MNNSVEVMLVIEAKQLSLQAKQRSAPPKKPRACCAFFLLLLLPRFAILLCFTPNPAPPPRTRVVLPGLPVEPAAVAEPEGGVELDEEAV
jgi:hypothetical protein